MWFLYVNSQAGSPKGKSRKSQQVITYEVVRTKTKLPFLNPTSINRHTFQVSQQLKKKKMQPDDTNSQQLKLAYRENFKHTTKIGVVRSF